MNDIPPLWDPEQAEELIGAVVLVGMTYDKPDGKQLDQFFGTVIAATEKYGITLRLGGKRSGETYLLPPHLDAFLPAKPGSYRLKTTGEVVNDPDYVTTWTVTPPPS